MCAAARKPTKADDNPIAEALRAALREGGHAGLCIAFSGGPDSTALLHALALLPQARERGLRALHVDHGLHTESAHWAQRCRTVCESLDVPLRTERVRVDDARGEGVEAAARHARRGAFADAMHDGEWLALAHHRDDQIETVLLKLLRGAGPEGLGGMPVLRPFARGFLWRPLLDIPRDRLREYVTAHHLSTIDDPANENPRFSRNILRNEILPRIAQHWPHADASILHAAQLCRAASHHMGQEAESALAMLGLADTLDAVGWLALPDALRAPVLHRWLRERGLPTPGDAQYLELQHQASMAAEDALPCVGWPGAEVRVWDGHLHATPPLAPPPDGWHAEWNGMEIELLPRDCGSLTLETSGNPPSHADRKRFDPPLCVSLRRGGEHIKPVGDPHTRELRDLFQRARIPPWVRARCPLIFEGGSLVAVADLWLDARGKALFDARGVRPRWNRPTWMNAP